jgi:serine/threonine protein kinase
MICCPFAALVLLNTSYCYTLQLFDRIVKKSYYNEKEARDLCRILLDSIKYIHDRDIVHRCVCNFKLLHK